MRRRKRHCRRFAVKLAFIVDAPHTPAIQKLASDLGKNPHKIYQWVHDNIHWQPTVRAY